jgi:phosphatidylglycerophosphate synthase
MNDCMRFMSVDPRLVSMLPHLSMSRQFKIFVFLCFFVYMKFILYLCIYVFIVIFNVF